jgi:hypothetical protein
MGVAILFEGRLRDEAAYGNVISTAKAVAAREGWGWREINEIRAELQRVLNEETQDYLGPVRGIVLSPHDNCEPLRFECDADRFMRDYVKTQFAPISIHIAIVELLKQLAPQFVSLTVEDEAEYWETGDRETLDRNLQSCFRAMEVMLANDPRLRGPVRLPNGRIADTHSRRRPRT